MLLEGSTPKTFAFDKFTISFKKVPSLLPASTKKLFHLVLNFYKLFLQFFKCDLETIELSEVYE